MKFSHKHLISLLIFGFSLIGSAQNSQQSDSLSSVSSFDISSKKYLTFGFGYNSLKYRDFATSPLFYQGGTIAFDMGYRSVSNRWTLGINFGVALTDFDVLSLNLFKVKSEIIPSTSVDVIRFNTGLEFLKKINPLGESNFDIRLGGFMDTTLIYRLNNSLNNNRLGFDIFSSLFASGLLTYHCKDCFSSSRFLSAIIPRNSAMGFRLNIPVMYANYRTTNYIYVSDESVRNKVNEDLYNELKFYQGFRINTTLDYKIYLVNDNVLRFSYRWNLYKTSENSPGEFQYADHLFLVSLMFKIN